MLFSCARVRANFPSEALRLENREPARLVWDEHGGTFVLRVEGLEVMAPAEPEEETGILLEVALPEPATLAQSIENFAVEHSLRLGLEPAGAELSEAPILAACHVPGKNLFIFGEDSQITLRLKGPQTLEMRLSGVFKARRVPSRELDIVIHLTMASVVRLLTGLLAWSRKGT